MNGPDVPDARTNLLAAFHEFQAAGTTSATFAVSVDDVWIGRYREVSGLEVKAEPYKYVEGGVNGYVHQLPGKLEWPNIVLTRGVTMDDALFKWFKRTSGAGSEGFVTKGELPRVTATIFLMNRMNMPIRVWNLLDAFPVRWTGPKLAANTADVATEELEVAHHGFEPYTIRTASVI